MLKPDSFLIKFKVNSKYRKISVSLDGKIEDEYVSITAEKELVTGGLRLKIQLTPKQSALQLEDCEIELEYDYKKTDRIFLNGYQTWTESREFAPNEKIPPLNKFLSPINRRYQFKQYGDYFFYPYSGKKGDLHSYTYSYIRDKEQIEFIGSLSEKTGYTIIQHQTPKKTLFIKKDCKGLVIDSDYQIFDILLCNGKEDYVFDLYFQLMGVTPPKYGDAVGWTSWYNYYTDINEEIILENLNAFVENQIPVDIFQIDDGYQQAVGDWLITNAKFPLGMKGVADQIKEKGFKAGLWLAPFVCEKNSELFKNNKSWLLKDEFGKPIVAGFCHLWSGRFYALDIGHPEVRNYLKQVFQKVLDEWGFDMVKLDFLYAAALKPKKNKTRGQVMCEGMELLRELVGDKIILGCGVPLGPSFGLVDYCRIGSDIALKWEDHILKDGIRYRERVSTYNALMNAIGRRHLNGRAFVNDPDVYLLRDENISMSITQKRTLLILNVLFGGLLFTSDNLNSYYLDNMDLYRSQFPVKERNIQSVTEKKGVYTTHFHSEEKEYLILSNLNHRPTSVKIPDGLYFGDEVLYKNKVKLLPYETKCLLKVLSDKNGLIGSSGHIFPCMEVESWSLEDHKISFSIYGSWSRPGKLFFRVPKNIKEVQVNYAKVETKIIGGENIAVIEIY